MQTPNKKVSSGALAGALSVILVWAVGLAGLDVPGEVGAAVATALGFVTAYFVKE